MKPSEQLREIVESMEHTGEGDYFIPPVHIPENCFHCKFEFLIPAVEQLEQAQHERDAEIRGNLYDILNHTQMDVNARKAISEVIQKLGGT